MANFNINQRLNGLNPLSYAGVNASQPPQFVTKATDPTPNDSKNFYLGTLWLNTATEAVWMLVSLAGNVATWVMITGAAGSILTLTGNVGAAVGPTLGNVNVIGDGVGVFVGGNPGTSTLTISLIGGGVAAQSFPTDSGTATPNSSGVLNIKAQTSTLVCGSSVEFQATTNNVDLLVSDSGNNTIIGKNSGNLTLTSTNTTVLGVGSATALTSSSNNTIIGRGSATSLTSGSGSNTILGQGVATSVVSGSSNLIVGAGSGSNLTGSESNNLLINNAGITGKSAWIIVSNGAGTRFITTDMVDNQFVGINSGNTSLTGTNNTVFGAGSLAAITTSTNNEIFGNQVMTTATSGATGNCIFGGAAYHTGVGSNNVIFGSNSLFSATSASTNVCVGNSTGWDSVSGNGLTTGNLNILIGYTAGNAYRGAESGNIIIDNHTGIAVLGESNVTKIAGIRGVTTNNNNAVAVLIDSAGQLGTTSSSARYKENIKEMGLYSHILYQLNPVIFNYKKHSSEDKSVGLIAEDVYNVAPNLVVLDDEGLPETVKYHDLVPMLLNELIALNKRLRANNLRIDELIKRVEILESK